MAIPRSKNGRGSPSVDPPKSDKSKQAPSSKAPCLQCMGDKARRIRVYNHLYQSRYFCCRACAITFALEQAEEQGWDWCAECKTWMTDDCPCACERDELLGNLDNSLWQNAAEEGAS